MREPSLYLNASVRMLIVLVGPCGVGRELETGLKSFISKSVFQIMTQTFDFWPGNICSQCLYSLHVFLCCIFALYCPHNCFSVFVLSHGWKGRKTLNRRKTSVRKWALQAVHPSPLALTTSPLHWSPCYERQSFPCAQIKFLLKWWILILN